MTYFTTLLYSISLLLFVALALQSGYLFFFALAGRLFSPGKCNHVNKTGRFVIYLFCDSKDNVMDAVKATTSLCYPGEKKHIIVITHPLQPATALALQETSVQLVELSQTDHSKTKSLQLALHQTEGSFDYALLLNARDVCTKGFLYRMNDAFESGYHVVQGQHLVKNTGSVFSLLDAISEGIDTHIFCKSHQLLGLSSSITSSGVGIRFSLCKEIVPVLSHTHHLDKELELHLLRKHIQFGYAPKACLYEERRNKRYTDYQKDYYRTTGKSQRLRAYLSDGISELCKGNIDYLDKIFQSFLLPRVVLLGITPFAVLISFLDIPVLPADYWIGLWAITYMAILMSMPAKYITNRFLQAVFFLPVSFINMVKVVCKPKRSKRQNAYHLVA